MIEWTKLELIQWWEERAAIREYEGGCDRQRANYLAARELRDRVGRANVPKEIVDRIHSNQTLDNQRTLFE
jgi:hypothetical protein